MGNKLIDETARLSELVFGEPAEVSYAEAEELLQAGGIDPQQFKSALYQRMLRRSAAYSGSGRPVPPLVRKALNDLRPALPEGAEESTLFRTAKLAVARLLREIKEVPTLLDQGVTPVFTMAYRTRTELSARDRELLDQVAEDLRKRHSKAPADE